MQNLHKCEFIGWGDQVHSDIEKVKSAEQLFWSADTLQSDSLMSVSEVIKTSVSHLKGNYITVDRLLLVWKTEMDSIHPPRGGVFGGGIPGRNMGLFGSSEQAGILLLWKCARMFLEAGSMHIVWYARLSIHWRSRAIAIVSTWCSPVFVVGFFWQIYKQKIHNRESAVMEPPLAQGLPGWASNDRPEMWDGCWASCCMNAVMLHKHHQKQCDVQTEHLVVPRKPSQHKRWNLNME